MTEYDVLDDVPLPDKHKKWRFPFKTLEVGQCFIVKGWKTHRMTPYTAYANRVLGKTFVTRVTEGGVGVWRTG